MSKKYISGKVSIVIPSYIVSHKKNKGFSSAVNSGVEESSRKFVALLNNDATRMMIFWKRYAVYSK